MNTTPTNELPPDAITPARAAQLLHLNVCVVYRWIDSGKLSSWRVGGGPRARLWVSEADVRACIQERPAPRRKHRAGLKARQRQWTQQTLARFGLTPSGEKAQAPAPVK